MNIWGLYLYQFLICVTLAGLGFFLLDGRLAWVMCITSVGIGFMFAKDNARRRLEQAWLNTYGGIDEKL